MHQVIYEDQSGATRTARHLKVAIALEAGEPDRKDGLAALAHHFFAASSDEDVGTKAFEYAIRAGEVACSVTAYEEATALYERALALTERYPTLEPKRFDVSVALGHSQRLAGERNSAVVIFEKATELARARHSDRHRVQAILGYAEARREFIGVDPTLIALLEEALAIVGDDELLRVEVSSALATALTFTAAYERRIALACDAAEAARRTRDARTLLRAFEAHRWAIWGTQDARARLEITIEAAVIAERHADSEFVLEALGWEITDRLEMGDVAGVYVAVERYGRLGQLMGHPLATWRSAIWDAMRAMLEGRPDAEKLVHRAFEIGQRASHDNVAHYFVGQRVTLLRSLGRLTELRSELANVVQRFPAVVVFRATLAHVLAEVDDEPAARAEFEYLAANDFAVVAQDVNWLITLGYAADVCVYLHDRRRAERLYQLLLPWEPFNVVGGAAAALVGMVSLSLGQLAHVLDRPADAARHLEAAIERSLAMGARPWTARGQIAYANLLLSDRHAGKFDRASELIQNAESTVAALGLTGLAPSLDQLRQRLR